jgi:CRISPR-associated protein Cas5d
MTHFGIAIRVWGEYALFSRPEMKVERVSYDVPTPSAARGIIEAIYWKPEIRWHIDKIHVLNPIRTMNLRRNEVGSKIPANSVSKAMKDGHGQLGLTIEEDRQQRAAIMLCDVNYVIEAHFDILSGENNPGKHLEQFNRRAREGKCHHRPYLGCRECDCHFELIEDEIPKSSLGDRDLGFMLHDINFQNGMTAQFFRATMKDGIINVNDAEVRS